MTSTLDLLQQVQKKSEERQKSLVEVNQNALSEVEKSTKKSLGESESTIKTDITASRRRITENLKNEETLITTDIKTRSQNIKTKTKELEVEAKQALDSLQTLIKKILGNWFAVVAIILAVFVTGMFVGIALTKLISKPYQPTYQYYHDKKTQITYLVPLED